MSMTTMFLLNPGEVPPGRPTLDLTDVTTLQAQVATLQTQVTSLQTQATSLQTQAGQSQPTSLQAQATTAAGQITTIQGQIGTIQTQVATIQGQITTIQSQIATIQTQVAGNSTAISSNSSAISSNSSAITTIQGQVATIQGQVSTLQGQVVTIQGQITTIQGQITTIQANVASNLAAITKLQIHGLAQYNSVTATLNTNTSVATITGWLGSTTGSNLWPGASLSALISGNTITAPYTGMYSLSYYVVMTNTSAMTTSLTVNGLSMARGTGTTNSTASWTGVLAAGAPITVNLSYTTAVLSTAAFTSAVLNMNLLFVF